METLVKKASTNPRILKMIARDVSEKLGLHTILADYIGCIALGGVPIAVAVSLETGFPLIIIRKEVKEYGTRGQIVQYVIVVVDREEGTGKSLVDADVELIPIVKVSELLSE